jgi:hypothetical protein
MGTHRLQETYRTHHISVEAIKTQTGWYWSFLIDGRVQVVSKFARYPSAEVALRQGSAAARTRVDELTSTGWK